MKKSALALAIGLVPTMVLADYDSIDNYKGKAATQHTIEANKAFAKTLPWSDKTAFERTNRGLVAELEGDAMNVRARFPHYSKMNLKELPDTVNPSLYRQGMLNYAANGLYEVTEGVWQVRGADITNMTIYRSDNGYIIHDPLLTEAAGRAAWEFAKTHLPKVKGEHKITGVIYSHSHQDHFGGSRGVIDESFEGLIIAPDKFMESIAAEAMVGGNAMSRRSQYQYGTTLPTTTKGIVDNALGLAPSQGEITLVPHNREINEREEWVNVDGLDILFINMPDAEAPSEHIHWIPKYKALHTAELTYDGQHNIYTFRGAKTRDALIWSKYLHEIKLRFASEAKVLHQAHSAPVWNDGNNEIADYLTLQRDNYGFLHNQTMRLANKGVTVNDIGREIEKIIPQAQLDTWHTNGYHGSYSHNARAIVNLYLGYLDLNPVNVNPLQTVEKSCVYVKAAGEKTLVNAGQGHYAAGEYQEAAQLLNDVLQCNPANDQARQLLADSFEQQGYQSETMAWRNSYLQGAYELRTGHIADSIKMSSVDIIANTPTSGFLDFLAVSINGPKAIELGLDFSLTISHPDLDEHYYAEMSNGNLAAIKTQKPESADVILSIDKSDMTKILTSEMTLTDLLSSKAAVLTDDNESFSKMMMVVETFTPDFSIVPMPVTKQK
ncbi:alkyl/aryl-sulfatase [Vibrio mediterranei]|uniref:alkyl/aryl-sulfatase n=1 Tax=Vibrio mediterranei TaxID=689 RepID=UPI00148C4CA8|nr:alkyl sulfatase dimerization domain-containing protein [Vibrio mediterranei]NOI24514.1 MBL fold metallo-hydrolase [Vibrio mediterranei]